MPAASCAQADAPELLKSEAAAPELWSELCRQTGAGRGVAKQRRGGRQARPGDRSGGGGLKLCRCHRSCSRQANPGTGGKRRGGEGGALARMCF